MPINRTYIEAPDIKPLPFGLLSVADVTEQGPGHWMLGVEYESIGCAIPNVAVQPCDPQPGTNEVQTATISGAPTGGTFTLSAFGETTAPIAYDATGATVQDALLALSAFQPGDVAVAGAAGGPYTMTFGGQYATEDVPQVTAVGSFTGGTTPTITTATTTGGVRTPKIVTPGGGTITADPYTVYVLYGCRTMGDVQRSKSRAVEILNLGEGRAIEKGFWQNQLAGDPDVVNLTGAGAVSAEAGVAILEDFAAQEYGGVPTLHLPRKIASIAATKGALERRGNHMESKLGALVAAGGGYSDINTGPGGSAAPAGESWAYITGAVTVMRGTATVQGPLMRTIDGDNEMVSLAERTFVAATECLVAAIRVTNPA